jgi:hypothetical protein
MGILVLLVRAQIGIFLIMGIVYAIRGISMIIAIIKIVFNAIINVYIARNFLFVSRVKGKTELILIMEIAIVILVIMIITLIIKTV